MTSLGIGMGPFKLMNVTGIPIAYHSCESLANKLGPFLCPHQIGSRPNLNLAICGP